VDIEDNTGVSSDAISYLESHPWGIEIPAPTDAAELAAQWTNDPMEMLIDLTAGLNSVLCDCRLQFTDTSYGPKTSFYLAYVKEPLARVLGPLTQLNHLARTAIIRNTIQQTPFNPQTIRELEHFLLTPVDEPPTQDDTLYKLIDAYQLDLEVLADWIEAKKILAGKRSPATPDETPDCPDGKVPTASFEDVRAAFEEIQQRGLWPTKERVGELVRQSKTISTQTLWRCLRTIRDGQ
jgi:hypothetical protein